MTAPAPPRTNTLALVGFIAAFIVPIAGLVLGIIARNQLKRPGNVETGTGLARWAMILGALGSAATLVFFLVWLGLFVSLITGHAA
ncbi:DUF4190 domain-containing protein [Microbacterium sp. 1P10AE]|uniref:DUF4190 domain-containing protein n=1 Tax=Microbacterium sp. 1P10AE TaxID=3132286 RepID=UPI0039A11A53